MFFLLLLVMTSVLLTSFIIFRPAFIFLPNQTFISQQNGTKDKPVQNATTIIAEDVFMPTRYIAYKDDHILMTSNQDVLDIINKSLNDSFTQVNKGGLLEQYFYEQLIFKESRANLLFDRPIPFGVVARLFDEVPEGIKNDVFTRIVYSSLDDSTVYFINDANRQVYIAKVLPEKSAWISQVNQKEEGFHFIESYVLKEGLVFVQTGDIVLPKLTYLVEQTPTNYYINHLFSDTSELRNRSDGSATIYNDNLSQLKIDRVTKILTFFRNQQEDRISELSENITQAFYQMRKFENVHQTVRYAGFSEEDQAVQFIHYVRDFPILSSNGAGYSRYIVTKEGISQMRLSTWIAQTPITKREEKVTLLSGKDVIGILLSNNISLTSIDSLRIGYDWQTSSENNRLIQFVPKWFVKSEGTWEAVDQFIEQYVNKQTGQRETTPSQESGGE